MLAGEHHLQVKCESSWWERDLPDGPGVETPCFQCMEDRFDPWSGKQDPACPWCGQKKKKKRERERER